jgi:drug/metabolite transporter (DMT)-like permease
VGGRQLNFFATERLGASRAASVFACSPMVAVGIATLGMGEQVTGLMLLGTALIIAGVILVVSG